MSYNPPPPYNPNMPYNPTPNNYRPPYPGLYPDLGQMPAGGYPGSAPPPPGSYIYRMAETIQPTPVVPQSPVEWIVTTPQHASAFADRVVVAGYEGHDGSPLWIIRAHHGGDLVPGKIAVKHRAAYVPWGGKEVNVQNIEICCARPEKVKWVPSRDGQVPPKAIPGGHLANGETLYIGRVEHQKALTPGKIHPSHQVLYISFGGQELPHKHYEVLCEA